MTMNVLKLEFSETMKYFQTEPSDDELEQDTVHEVNRLEKHTRETTEADEAGRREVKKELPVYNNPNQSSEIGSENVWFASFDCTNGNVQVNLSKDARLKTIFMTTGGIMCYTIAP